MSLINDALKKAARQRSEEQAESPAPVQGGRKRIARRGAPMSVQTLVLLAAGAVTLIVASVVMTGIFITGKLETRPAAARPPPVSPTPEAPPAVVVSVPVVAQEPVPRPTAPPPTAAPVAAALASPTPLLPAPAAAAVPEPAAPVAAPAVVRSAPAAAPLSHGDQVQDFIDKLRVTGVRTAGTDSKALVDGHVYRVNDILDRALGIRLVQVDADHLTLVDSAGVTYVKNF